MLPLIFIGPFVVWIVSAIAFHVLSTFGDGDGSFGNTLSVTGWGMLPSLLQLFGGFGLLYVTLRDVQFASNPEAVMGQMQSLMARI